MKKIWKMLVAHVREDFNVTHYLVIAAFLTASVYFNYKYEFEDTVLEQQRGVTKFINYILFYSIAVYFASLSYLITSKKLYILVEPEFWFKTLATIIFLSLDAWSPFLREGINTYLHPAIQFWSYKVGVNVMSFFTILFPILIFRRFYEPNEPYRYGLHTKKVQWGPYFTMLMIVIPLIFIASFEQSFIRQYPMYKVNSAHVYLGLPEWLTTGIYEFVYGMDFVTVEFIFRGFMVIGMMQLMGRGSVLIMATTYCFLHFGKPAGEAISSIFGGYILGVIAYETKNIWGGIILHIGIAWSMELMAYLQKTYAGFFKTLS